MIQALGTHVVIKMTHRSPYPFNHCGEVLSMGESCLKTAVKIGSVVFYKSELNGNAFPYDDGFVMILDEKDLGGVELG